MDDLDRASEAGWTMTPFKDGTGLCFGVVYLMTGRDGKTRYVPGYQFGGVDDGPTLDFSSVETEDTRDYHSGAHESDAARSAARIADSLAQHAAEEEREYQSAWQAGARYASEGETVDNARQRALKILEERHAVRTDTARYPALCEAIRDKVSDLMETIREARETRRQLRQGGTDELSFWPGDPRMKDAFNAGAGAKVLA